MSSGVNSIDAAANHLLAIQNGGAYAWGQDNFGQLGNGMTNLQFTPVAVSGLSSGVTAIAGGSLNSLAIQNGGVYAWGSNSYGQLGNGTTSVNPNPRPVAVAGLVARPRKTLGR